MTIRPYSSIEAQIPQPIVSPHEEENVSPPLEAVGNERPSKQLRMGVFSSDQKEARPPQTDESLKIEQIANAVLRIDPNHVDPSLALLGSKHDADKESMIMSIHLDPRDANAYAKLAKCLQDNEVIKLLNGETYTKRALYIKAIDLHPNQGNFYRKLGALLEENETLQLLNGETYTERVLYIKALDLNPQDKDSYFNLASLMEENETIQLLNGEIYAERDLYLKAIDLNPQDEGSYYNLASLMEKNETIQLLNGENYTKSALYLKAIDLNPKDESSYYNLASLMEKNEKIQFLNGEIYTKRALYIKLIDLNPLNEKFYCSLVCLLEKNEKIQLLNGEVYTKREFFIKLLDINAKEKSYYSVLANCLEDNEKVQLLNGEVYTTRELYIQAIDLDPQYCNAYLYLATLLEKNETIQLLNGTVYSNKELYIQVIHLNPEDQDSYYDLALLLERGERIQLLNHELYTAKDLYLKTIDLDPKHQHAYYSLALLLDDDESIELLNGKVYTKKELYIQFINLDPKYSGAYFNLAALLEDKESIQFLNDELYTAIDLYLKVIDLNPQDQDAYYYLAARLKENETLKLLNGQVYTVKDLYLKTLDLDPENQNAYCLLAQLLNKTEKIQFLNGEFFTKKELFLKALSEDLIDTLAQEARESLKQIYIQEIEENPKNIESYFDLIAVIKHTTASSWQKEIKIHQKNTSMESLFRDAIDLDPVRAFSAQFAPAFFSMGSFLHHKTVSILNNINKKIKAEDLVMRETLLKEGTSITLKNHKVLSTKAIYHHALSYLSSSDLKLKGDEEVGHYLSSIKPITLQDGVKFTPLMAYTYAYQKRPLKPLLIKIGDALHPEERVLLNGKIYEKRTCYAEASRYKDGALFLKHAESLYPHDDVKQKKLVSDALRHAYLYCKDHWESYITLARILSQDAFKELSYPYLLIFEECLESYKNLKNEKTTTSLKDYHSSLNSPYTSNDLEAKDINEDLYFAKKQAFLLKVLHYLPACEDAYIALATTFQNPLMIHEKSYPSKESLYLKAIAINPEYSLPYFLLGKELFYQKIETIQLLNGVTLSCKQLLMRSIQLGTYKAEAYHLAALLMKDKEGITLFDEKTTLSRGDLFIRAFELDSCRIIDLKNFISYVKRASLKP